MYAIELATENFKKWVGYCEKKNLASIGIDLDNPENFTKNAGSENYTIFAKAYKAYTGIDVQGQPWCDTFIDTIFIHLFGVGGARILLGGFSAYTPTSAQNFKNMYRYFTNLSAIQEGDIIFFRNSERINHTGYIAAVTDTTITTIEGNTSSTSAIVENGGLVALKTYKKTDITNRFDGFGRPHYLTIIPEGWKKAADDVQWWFMGDDGNYLRNGLYEIDGLRYHFNEKGFMSTGNVLIDGERHEFSRKNDDVEGAEYVINDTVGFRRVVK